MDQPVETARSRFARAPSAHSAGAMPNLLTYGRIAAVPVLVGCLMFLDGDVRHWAAFLIFIAAALTDWLDGYLARSLSLQSALGRMLDPIADKLLVGAVLIMLVHDQTIHGVSVIAAVVILCREILVSGLREFLAGLQVKMHVTTLSKWKTAVQMAALAALLLGSTGERLMPGLAGFGITLLWIAAALTVWTGFGYLRAGIARAMEE
jgi:CDP-diacylglycerol--glycerol-3-phosphate 3-phosphatidyltransferase/cardiolipin synthase